MEPWCSKYFGMKIHVKMLFAFTFLFLLSCTQAKVAEATEVEQSLSCWGWQENADFPKQEFTCPQADHKCVRYYDKVEEATFATCVSSEKCEFMKLNTAVWEDVNCCSTPLCNDPDAGMSFFLSPQGQFLTRHRSSYCYQFGLHCCLGWCLAALT